ncbi:MAG: VPLPA-CTERM sorting domain-containing protein [Pseudomonadota bacterium]
MKKLLATTALLLGAATVTNAHSIGIADVVSGDAATIWLSTYHSSAGLEGGVILMGPGQGTGGTGYAFDTDHNLGINTFFSGFAGYDAGPFYSGSFGQPDDWQSVTISGLANGSYTYQFTNTVGGQISADYSPNGGDYAKYNGSFNITEAVSAVPLPAGGMLLLTAIGAMAFGRRRKS